MHGGWSSRCLWGGAGLLLPLLVPGCDDPGDSNVAEPLAILTATLPRVALGSSYDVKVEVSGGTAPYSFSVSQGALPSGLDLSRETGQIRGIAQAPGIATFTVRVETSARDALSASKELSIYVIPEALSFVTTRLPSGKEGTPYNQVLSVSGGVLPRTFRLSSGSLPLGVTLEAEGRIQGTPTEFGGFDFTVTVTDAENSADDQALHLMILSLSPLILTSTIPKGRVDQVYEARLEAGGGQPPYTWSMSAGRLPSGILLANDGSVVGTSTSAGNFAFTARVTDVADRRDEADLMLRVIAPLAIATTAVPHFVLGRTTSFPVVATGGETPYAWSLGGGTLPSGISLSSDGVLSGTAATIGEFPVTLRVVDTNGERRSALFTLKVSNRQVYEVTPALSFPPVCTGTTSSYASVDLDVPESMQVADLEISVDVDWVGPNQSLKLNLYGPDGTRSVLCGGGAEELGGRDCAGANGIDTSFDDQTLPEVPLRVFEGQNPRGVWRFSVGVVDPKCTQQGSIQRVTLSIQDDRSTAPYVIVRGYTTNNLIIEPWVRIAGGGLDQAEIFLAATAYDVGPNLIREGGFGDDVPELAQLSWSWQSAPIPQVTLTPDGHVRAGAVTGQANVVATGGGFTVTTRLRVVPPDWNPLSRVY